VSWFGTDRLIRKAHKALSKDGVIPLDLYAQLDAAGVDINELTRNFDNG